MLTLHVSKSENNLIYLAKNHSILVSKIICISRCFAIASLAEAIKMIACHQTVNCARRILSMFYIWKLSRHRENANYREAREKPAPLLAFGTKARHYANGQVFERGSQPVMGARFKRKRGIS